MQVRIDDVRELLHEDPEKRSTIYYRGNATDPRSWLRDGGGDWQVDEVFCYSEYRAGYGDCGAERLADGRWRWFVRSRGLSSCTLSLSSEADSLAEAMENFPDTVVYPKVSRRYPSRIVVRDDEGQLVSITYSYRQLTENDHHSVGPGGVPGCGEPEHQAQAISRLEDERRCGW